MVTNNSIAFAAPSQVWLATSRSDDDTVSLTILNPFNQPLGNLKDLKVPLSELKAFAENQSGTVTASNGEAIMEIMPGSDSAHEMMEVHYKDEANWIDSKSRLMVHDVQELVIELGKAVVAE